MLLGQYLEGLTPVIPIILTLYSKFSLGPTETQAREQVVDVTYIDQPDNPWLTFDFAYRSRGSFILLMNYPRCTRLILFTTDLLEIEGIIPSMLCTSFERALSSY